MSDNRKLQFRCRECGSNWLGYEKYARCYAHVDLLDTGNVEYGPLELVDEDDYMFGSQGYVCGRCDVRVEHCGGWISEEKQLIDYLTMDPKARKQEDKEYWESIDAQIKDQKQKEAEQADAAATTE